MVVTGGKLSDLVLNTGDAAGALRYSHLTVTHSQALAGAHAGEVRFQLLLATAQLDYGFKLFKIRGDSAGALRNMQPAVEQLARVCGGRRLERWTGRTLALGYGRIAEVLRSNRSGRRRMGDAPAAAARARRARGGCARQRRFRASACLCATRRSRDADSHGPLAGGCGICAECADGIPLAGRVRSEDRGIPRRHRDRAR